MSVLFEIRGYRYSLYKGDDSLIKCDSVALTAFGKDLLDSSKHKLKLHTGNVGEFAGFIVTEYGFFPDLPRKCAKFFGKLYRNQEHFDESKKSAFACTEVVRTQFQLEQGIASTAYYYDGKYTPAELRAMFYTLRRAPHYVFNQLVEATVRPTRPL